jgi:hypothetical protein
LPIRSAVLALDFDRAVFVLVRRHDADERAQEAKVRAREMKLQAALTASALAGGTKGWFDDDESSDDEQDDDDDFIRPPERVRQ